jgi:hypothetical protein
VTEQFKVSHEKFSERKKEVLDEELRKKVCMKIKKSADSKQKTMKKAKLGRNYLQRNSLRKSNTEYPHTVFAERRSCTYLYVQPNASHSLEKLEHNRSCKEKQEQWGMQ